MIPTAVALAIAAGTFILGAATALAWQRRRHRSKTGRRLNRQPLAGCEDVFPVGIAPFRALVRLAGERKAATLSTQFGHPLTFTAQDGEDILLAELFACKPAGYYVEIGAYDGVHLSNTYFFEQLGWQGLLIEPLPDQVEACRRNRPGSIVVHAAVGNRGSGTIQITEVLGGDNGTFSPAELSFVETTIQSEAKARQLGQQFKSHDVPLRTFEAIAEEVGLEPGTAIDLISIDCEGMDFEVLQSIDLKKWRPRLLLIERVEPALVAYLAQRGYGPLLRIRANTIFSREPGDRAVLSRQGYWQALGLGRW
ncbi:MAG: FkbM family methyltransferase [Chloroflexi bacterium]|nr:FkbM family methyltransferase [Chloroflexota bacterium]MCI0645868.1 FkbM family methyltransferase [Chloroflexota bacterium]MCI0725723.1 FkbM family methyltransferase [Chloroflexota bacterium]